MAPYLRRKQNNAQSPAVVLVRGRSGSCAGRGAGSIVPTPGCGADRVAIEARQEGRRCPPGQSPKPKRQEKAWSLNFRRAAALRCSLILTVMPLASTPRLGE